MSDAFPLPPRPNLEQYKKLAKELHHASSEAAIHAWAKGWVAALTRLRAQNSLIDGSVMAADLARRWCDLRVTSGAVAHGLLADAQLFLAREHGFASWSKFAEHVQALAKTHSTIARFEAAVDAIVAGDLRALAALLHENSLLIRARSTRDHRSTLLHHVSANGVEDFRQKTPDNILAIARLLIEAGADVNAESDAYGGGSTTLLLVATSVHPERAGVQLPLLHYLLEQGAVIERQDGGSAVSACLRNGRGAAAEFLASRGARLDLEGAAGVGQLDAAQPFFQPDGTLRPPATVKQLAAGFGHACLFGRAPMVDFLLKNGMTALAALDTDGQTGLHNAALGGHTETIRTLLAHGADVNAHETRFNGRPVTWALYGWTHRAANDSGERYCEAVAALVLAGASTAWFDYVPDDPRMRAALRGEYKAP